MLKAQAASLRELLQGERQLTQAETALANAALATADDALLQAREIVAATAGGGTTGAWPYNRPCAQQYVGKSQSCMFISGRLIVHAGEDEKHAIRHRKELERICRYPTDELHKRAVNAEAEIGSLMVYLMNKHGPNGNCELCERSHAVRAELSILRQLVDFFLCVSI